MPDAPTVTVPDGTLRGVAGDRVLHFRGIPFAAPPVGDLRFRSPAPVMPWAGTRDATRYGPAAPQPVGDPGIGVGPGDPQSEDCLTLSVTVPAERSAEPRPVVVWIHGGAFLLGAHSSTEYEPTRLARATGAVVVGVNYRLGVLGWLDTSRYGTAERPMEGDLAIRDLIAALRWVQASIGAFGGDPGRVTVMGESAGGTAVLALLAAPSARGLLHRAVAESPAAGAFLDRATAAERAAEFVATLPGGEADPVSALLDADAAALTAAGVAFALGAEPLPWRAPLGPVVGGDLIPVHPIEAAPASEVPLLLGTNDVEGVFFQRRMPVLPVTREQLEPALAAAPAARETLLAAYPGWPGDRACAELGGDAVFQVPATRLAEARGDGPTWMYRFDFAPRGARLAGLDATHGFELPYIWDHLDSGFSVPLLRLGPKRVARALRDRMQGVWGAFIAGRDPEWPRYADDRATLVFDATDRLEHDPRAERRLAWEAFDAARTA